MHECHFCGTDENVRRNDVHWTDDEYIRVWVCDSGLCRAKVATRPRRPRRKREPVIVDGGGWVNIPGLNRVTTRDDV